jgi:hypothetical protein
MNALRGLLAEYREVMAKSRAEMDKVIPGALATLFDRLAALLIDSVCELWNDLDRVEGQIAAVERRVRGAGHRGPAIDDRCARLDRARLTRSNMNGAIGCTGRTPESWRASATWLDDVGQPQQLRAKRKRAGTRHPRCPRMPVTGMEQEPFWAHHGRARKILKYFLTAAAPSASMLADRR